jgi:two-component system, OmpR family, phosphate regulon sensor histidine kinase PhoR
LSRDAETMRALRGALGEPRIAAYDSGRYLIAARFHDATQGQVVGVRTLSLARAAGVPLGDSLRFVPAGATGTLQLGDGIEGLYLAWSRPAAAALRRPAAQLYYVVSILMVGVLGLLIAHFAARDVRRKGDATRLRQDFVAGVSHELKTPLTAIRVMAETLHDRDLPAETRRQYLVTMVGETGRLSRLVDNVVEFTRLENGERIYRIRDGDLAAVIRRAAQGLGYSLERDGFVLAMQCPESLRGVRLDDDAIEQVLLNLLANAAKYSGDSRQIEIAAREHEGEVEVSVRDFGIGIDPTEHSRIFDRFYRSPRVAPDIPGTGLGLTLARHIVTAHGGRLTVESRLGQGSIFHMHLPRSVAS